MIIFNKVKPKTKICHNIIFNSIFFLLLAKETEFCSMKSAFDFKHIYLITNIHYYISTYANA